MDQRADITDRLRRHRPLTWRPWRCSCGHRRPCPARQLALEGLRAWDNRDRMDRVITQMRNRSLEVRGGDRPH